MIIADQGSFTVETEVERSRKEIQKLAEFGAALIRTNKHKPEIGFGAGSHAQVERGPDWSKPEIPFVERRVEG